MIGKEEHRVTKWAQIFTGIKTNRNLIKMKSAETSRERLLGIMDGKEIDHVPLYSWVFGCTPPRYLRWKKNGKEVTHWYTMRLEHIHTLPEPWGIEDDFNRVKAWLSLGCDDILDVSMPWAMHKDVTLKDWREGDILGREYGTPAGALLQKVRKTDEEIPPGWVIQPDKLKLFEDFNLPRTIKFAVEKEKDLLKLKYLLDEPTRTQREDYEVRIAFIKKFSRENGVLVQGWSVFGMDGVVWLMGVENAVMAAMGEPEFFQKLVDAIYDFDLMRTKVMIDIGEIDMIVQRGWYSSTDFWSPKLFRQYVLPNLKKLVKLVHQAGLKYGYVMTTGVMNFLEDLEDAGVDLLYYVDPGQDKVDLTEVKKKLKGHMAVAGGINTSLDLKEGNSEGIRQAVFKAVKVLGKKKFILSPVDALFPDTSWESVEAMIKAWKESLGL